MIKIKEGFKNERVVSVSEKLLEEYRKDPLVRNLYIRKIGYFPQARFHFIQKADGCDYAIKSTAKLTYSERTSLSSFPRTLPTLSVRHPVILGVVTGFISKAHKPTVSSLRDMPRSLYNRETTPVYKTACGFLTRYSIISP